MVGRTISHYRIVAQLGSGGMGVVYRAEDDRLGRPVALKFVHEDLAHDPAIVERLRSEARAASALNHPNICTIYDIGENDGHPFIVMELMTGQTLREKAAHGRLKVHQVLQVGIEIADALDAAHAGGIIHRDIKPGNVFVTDRGHVKVLDFGLAKTAPRFAGSSATGGVTDLTVSGVTLGTPQYMSPEQATGEELDGRTDLFSLGVVLYEIATGQHPFPGKTSGAVLAAILTRAPVAPVTLNPELPQRLQDVINNCLEKDRELRYQSAADLRADLKRVKRDVESGHSRAVTVATATSGTPAPGAVSAESHGAPASAAAPSPAPPVASPPPITPPHAPGARAGVLVAAGVAALAAVAAGAFWLAERPVTPPQATSQPVPASSPSPAPSGDTDDDRLALARASLDAGSYHAARAYAAEVLARDPDQPEAARIRDRAVTMIGRAEAALDEARRQMAEGNVAGAARAIEEARAIDPTAPAVASLSADLADLARRRTDTARRTAPAATFPPRRGEGPSTMPTPPPVRGDIALPVPTSGASTVAATPTPSPVPPPTPQVPAPAPTPTVTPTPTAPAPQPSAPPTPVPPAPAPAPASPAATPHTPAARPAPADEDAAIRRVVSTYARAIETKDVALFRSVRPNLTRDEERRLQEGFRAVSAQEIVVTVLGIDRRGNAATVHVARRDTVHAGGRTQTAERQQTITLARGEGGWVIVDIR